MWKFIKKTIQLALILMVFVIAYYILAKYVFSMAAFQF